MAGEIEQDRRRFLGAVLEAIPVAAFSPVLQQRSVAGSPTGSPVTIETMLDFAARRNVLPQNEHYELIDERIRPC
jgi:uncharacterized zinc-type alcohol dehydrogenase-like protein